MPGDVTIDMPGKFSGFFSGSSVGQGQIEDSGYPGAAALWEAYRHARRIHRGHGHTVRLTFPRADAADALACLDAYAESCLVANSDYPDHAEVASARTMRDRIGAVYVALGDVDAPLLILRAESGRWGHWQLTCSHCMLRANPANLDDARDEAAKHRAEIEAGS
jgi:hypothetical protein